MQKLHKIVEVALLLMVAVPAIAGILYFLRFFGPPLWSQEGSGWAQAIGAVAAIWFSYQAGKKQADDALDTVREADKLSAQRRFDAVLAVADASRAYAQEVCKAFAPDRVSYLHLRICYAEQLMQNIMDSLQAVPAHELGSYQAVSAMLTLRHALNDFRGNVQRAIAIFDVPEDGIGRVGVARFERTAIDLCLSKIDECVQCLHDERALFN